jgi:ATP-dependent DNA helicase RecG
VHIAEPSDKSAANALIHRDFAVLGSVFVQWLPGSLQVSSPGGFPYGITPGNVLTHEPRPRNPRLAEACRRVGLMETTARGVDRIYQGQVRYGRPLPDYSKSDDHGVRLLLRGGKANLDFIRVVHEIETTISRLGLDELIALNQLQHERRISAVDLARHVQRGVHDARATLERLVERGILESTGQRLRLYHLSADAYRKLGASADYVRIRGFEPRQQEALILDYLRAHGRITRGEAVQLCRISSELAKKRLQRLADEGRIRLVGERRGAFYVPGEVESTSALVPKRGEELLELICEILSTVGDASLQEIEDALAIRGCQVAGQNKRNYLTGLMSRNKARFQGTGRGRYRLS